MQNTKTLRAAVIGLGVGAQHIEGYNAHPSCEVAALCDIDSAKLREVGARYPGVRLETDAQKILADPSIDVVSVASYDDVHFEQIMLALQNGKHVFAEKPMVLFEDQAKQIRAALRSRPELRLSSNLVLRQSPRFLEVKRLIDQGAMGELFYLEADYNFGRLQKITDGWRGKLEFYSAVHGGGVHMVDLLLWLTNDEVVEVGAFGNSIASRGSSFKEHDMVVSILKLRSGLVAKMAVNFGCVFPHFHVLNVYGTKATFMNDRAAGRLYSSREPGTEPALITSDYPGVHKAALIPSFLDSILGQERALVTEEDVFRTLSVCFAIERAHREGVLVNVEYL